MSAETQITPEVQPPVDVTEPNVQPQAPAEPEQPAEQGRTETERLDPQPVQARLSDGTEIDVEPLKLRQFLALLRILTRGAGAALTMGGLSARDNEDFMRQLMAMLLFAIPEAEQETIDFVKSMVRPKGAPAKLEGAWLSALEHIHDELDNPELEDLVTIVELVVQNEAADLRALGNRLRSMFDTATKMGLTKTIS